MLNLFQSKPFQPDLSLMQDNYVNIRISYPTTTMDDVRVEAERIKRDEQQAEILFNAIFMVAEEPVHEEIPANGDFEVPVNTGFAVEFHE